LQVLVERGQGEDGADGVGRAGQVPDEGDGGGRR
jgi:hypothetical protein